MSIQSDILQKYGDRIAEQFRQSVPKVTGKTAASIHAVTGEDFIEIWGAKYIFALEYGRGPTTTETASTPTLFDAIKEWAMAKGIINDDSKKSMGIVGAITRSIHKRGTLLFLSGTPSGVLSRVVDDLNMNSMLNELSLFRLGEIEDDIEKEFQRLY